MPRQRKYKITLQRLIEEAADIQKRATKAGQYSAAIAALISRSIERDARSEGTSTKKGPNVIYIRGEVRLIDRPLDLLCSDRPRRLQPALESRPYTRAIVNPIR